MYSFRQPRTVRNITALGIHASLMSDQKARYICGSGLPVVHFRRKFYLAYSLLPRLYAVGMCHAADVFFRVLIHFRRKCLAFDSGYRSK